MADVNRTDTAQLVTAASEIASIRKDVSNNVDSAHAVLRKMLESNTGEGADDLAAVAEQLKKSSSDIIAVLHSYETVLREVAGVYDQTEKKNVNTTAKLKFGGLR